MMTQHDHGQSHAGGADADRLTAEARAQSDQARREAGSVADEARGAARDVAGEARRAGEAIKQEATGLAGTVKQQLASQAQAQKAQVAERISTVAQHFQHTAEELRGREAWLAELLDRGSRQLDGFAQGLRERDLRSMVGEVENLAHRHPALFMGTAVALGFALSRMVRAGSAEERYRYESERYRYGGAYGSSGYAGAGASGYETAGSGYGAAGGRYESGTTGSTGSYVDEDASRPDVGVSPVRSEGFGSAPGYTSATSTGSAAGYPGSTGDGERTSGTRTGNSSESGVERGSNI